MESLTDKNKEVTANKSKKLAVTLTRIFPILEIYKGEKISREDAKLLGLTRFFTGRVCPNNHIAQQLVSSCKCVQCKKDWSKRNIESEHKRQMDWYWNNRDKKRKYRTAWYAQNKEKRQKSDAEYQKNNKDKITAHQAKRRTKKSKAGGFFPEKDIKDILRSQKYKCAYCPKNIKKKYHMDHITPVSKGGTSDRKNMQATCSTCNHKKHAKDPLEWARQIGKLL